MPAIGWVQRIYRRGQKLLGDFSDLPTIVYNAIQEARYKFISIELLKNVQADTRVIPWVLDAVALLGADQPAVGTLKDLQSLTMARKPVLQARARVAFTRGKLFSTGATKAMDEKEVQALVASAVDKAIADANVRFTKQLTDELTKANAAAKADADARIAKAAAESHRARIKEKFETAVKAEILLPAKRESFYKRNKVDDDAAVMTITSEEVDEYIEEFADKAKLEASRKTTTQQGDNKDDEKGLRPDQVLHKRAEKLCYSRQQDPRKGDHYSRAVAEILQGDSKLSESYKYMPDTEYRQAS